MQAIGSLSLQTIGHDCASDSWDRSLLGSESIVTPYRSRRSGLPALGLDRNMQRCIDECQGCHDGVCWQPHTVWVRVDGLRQLFLELRQSMPTRCHRRCSGSRAERRSTRCQQQSETSRCHRQLEYRVTDQAADRVSSVFLQARPVVDVQDFGQSGADSNGPLALPQNPTLVPPRTTMLLPCTVQSGRGKSPAWS